MREKERDMFGCCFQPRLLWFAAIFACMLTLPGCQRSTTASQALASETGRWITGNANLEVEIAPCDQALCGTVTKVLANRSMNDPGKTMVPADSRSALGMKILIDFVADGSGERVGHIYNRENAKTYRCLMRLQGANELEVRPYIGLSWFGKSQIWHRVSETLDH